MVASPAVAEQRGSGPGGGQGTGLLGEENLRALGKGKSKGAHQRQLGWRIGFDPRLEGHPNGVRVRGRRAMLLSSR